MKPTKWPRAPPPSSVPKVSPSFAAAFAQRRHDTPTPSRQKPSRPDYSHMRNRLASQSAEDSFGKPRQEWPQLKRRAPEEPAVATEIPEVWPQPDPWARQAATRKTNVSGNLGFAAALQRAGSSKVKFAAKKGKVHGFGRAEVDWSRLEAAPGVMEEHIPRVEEQEDDEGDEWLAEDYAGEGLSEQEMEAQRRLKADEKKHMLLIRAASRNLTASDFHRIAPKSLSSWSSSIKKVEQQRDPQTLRPLGCYQVSFISSYAAESYLHNLVRLQRLAQHQFSSATGLWQATVPDYLLRPNMDNSNDELERDVQSLTLSSPSQPSLDIKRTRTITKYPWTKELKSLVGDCGFGDRPPVAVISVVPGVISDWEMQNLIEQDGIHRDLAWKASKPIPLNMKKKKGHLSSKAQAIQDETKEAGEARTAETEEEPVPSEARYVLAFESDWVARSFQRSWHQRVLTTRQHGSRGRAMAKVEVIEW